MTEVQKFLREAWAAAEREKAIEDAVAAEQVRARMAEAARAAAEAQRLRRNAASKKNAETGGEIGTVIGGIVIGFAGCASCLSHHFQAGDFPLTPFNLITGWFLGMVVGAAIGSALGYLSGQNVD
jgi:uncharacterized protein YcfJ